MRYLHKNIKIICVIILCATDTDTDGDSENSEDGDSDGSALLLRREHKKSSNTKRRYAPRLAKVGHLDFSGHATFCTYFVAIVSQKTTLYSVLAHYNHFLLCIPQACWISRQGRTFSEI